MSVMAALDKTGLKEFKEFVLAAVMAFGELPEAMPARGKPWAWTRASRSWNGNLELIKAFLGRDAGQRGFHSDNLGFGDVTLSFDWEVGGEPAFKLSVHYQGNARPSVPVDYAHQVFMKWWGLCDQKGVDMSLFATHCDYEEN